MSLSTIFFLLQFVSLENWYFFLARWVDNVLNPDWIHKAGKSCKEDKDTCKSSVIEYGVPSWTESWEIPETHKISIQTAAN